MIYFVKDTVSLAIKIGYSKTPKQRIGGLQTGNPHKLILLGTVKGNEVDEVRYHDQFAAYRMEGEWFKGDIIEEVLTIIETHKQQRRELRRQTMAETTPEGSEVTVEAAPQASDGDKGVSDKDSGILGVCRIPGLRIKSFTFKLTESPYEPPTYELPPDTPQQHREQQEAMWAQQREHFKGHMTCGMEARYLLEFVADMSKEDTQRLFISLLPSGQKGICHTFTDEDNAVVPFNVPADACHVVGSREALTGVKGDAFRVLVSHERTLAPKSSQYRGKITDVFVGDNYPGEHPLKKAKRVALSVL